MPSTDPQFKLPDDGLRYGNLALTRSPQMPAVLIESAYMIVPEEEAYLKQERFHEACAEAIIRGLEAYARKRGPDEEQSL
ncbi:N-acetylmuramoyl-L-alanine amidase family protein [Mycobacterium tuberculosis]|uniref:N-acetylmuramoyl-L-alanine amidase family protein n=1 Tax=Mycobacterium tuberculosis TaxID=1773 RepID=UPI00099BAA18